MDTVNDKTLIKDKCFVAGEWIAGSQTMDVSNPATGEVIATVPKLSAGESEAAVAGAQAAMKGWAKKTAKERSVIMRRWYDLMMENQEDLARIITAEQGKPLAEARGEIVYGASFTEFYAEECKRIYGETIPSHKADARIVVIRQPIGVVAAITPWNFPMAMITRKVSPAIAAGCGVVCKPASETPLTALALAELGERAGLPRGLFSVVTGAARDIGAVLTKSETVKALTFTGSTDIGRILMEQCASTIKKVDLELGGNAPFIVLDDADLDAAVIGAMASKYRKAG